MTRKTDTIARATVMAGRLHELRDDVQADSQALDASIAAYHAAEGDPKAREAAERKVTALLQAILSDLAALRK